MLISDLSSDTRQRPYVVVIRRILHANFQMSSVRSDKHVAHGDGNNYTSHVELIYTQFNKPFLIVITTKAVVPITAKWLVKHTLQFYI